MPICLSFMHILRGIPWNLFESVVNVSASSILCFHCVPTKSASNFPVTMETKEGDNEATEEDIAERAEDIAERDEDIVDG